MEDEGKTAENIMNDQPLFLAEGLRNIFISHCPSYYNDNISIY